RIRVKLWRTENPRRMMIEHAFVLTKRRRPRPRLKYSSLRKYAGCQGVRGMVVLHLISSEGFYGAESMVGILGRKLQRRGWRPIIGAFRDSRNPHLELAERAQAEGLETEIIPCRGRLDWRAVRHVRKVLANRGVDVLHAHGYKPNLYGCAAAWR